MVGKSNPCFFSHGGEIEEDGTAIERIAVGHEIWIIVGSDWFGIQLFLVFFVLLDLSGRDFLTSVVPFSERRSNGYWKVSITHTLQFLLRRAYVVWGLWILS